MTGVREYENTSYAWDRRGNRIYFMILVISGVVVWLTVYAITLKLITLLALPISFLGGVSIYVRIFMFPLSISLSSDGLNLNYRFKFMEKTYPWKDIEEARTRYVKGDLLTGHKHRWRSVRLRLAGGKRKFFSINVSNELYEVIRSEATRTNPRILWKESRA